VIALCYEERPARPVTALTGAGDTPCRTGCSCGVSGSCTCGKAQSAPAPKARRGYKPQCEPTQVCEGYRFIAYKAPAATRLTGAPPIGSVKYGSSLSPDLLFAWLYANRTHFGPLLERVLCCFTRAMELRAAAREGKPVDNAFALDTYREYAEALREFAADFAQHRCTFVGKAAEEFTRMKEYLRATPAATVNGADISQRITQLDLIWLDILTECFCSALLPACPAPVASNCVPLAVVTLKRDDCRVIEICNWEERKLLITWTTIGYWLSWLPWGSLRRAIARLCCGSGRGRDSYFALVLILASVLLKVQAEPDSTLKSKMAAAGAAPVDTVMNAMNADSLLVAALQDFDRTRTGDRSIDAPFWATLLARFTDGSALMPLGGEPPATDAAARDLSVKLGVEELRERVVELTTTLNEYKGTLDTLKNLWRRA
jgi:hypothetical protein